MRMMAAAGLVFVATMSVHAEDLSPAASELVAPAAFPFTWSGFYAGVNAGAAFNNSSVANKLGGEFVTDPFAADYEAQYPGVLSADDTAFTGGGELGANWQFHMFVLGAEADINYLGLDESQNDVFTLTGNFAGVVEDRRLGQRIEWYGTLRARAGIAVDRLLVYATGGLAYGEVKASARQIEGLASDWNGISSDTKAGWTAGGGVEYAVNERWVVGLEYLHVDLGSDSFDMPDVNGNTFTMSADADAKFDVVRARASYKF